ETDETGALVRGYIRLDGLPLAMVTGDGSMYYYHTDHLGTPLRLTDASGTVVWAADYQPFGKATLLVNTVENNLRFLGQYFDAETGLHYNWHRYYDPDIGRYLSADPIGLEAGVNVYAYVNNDPVNKIDPWGLAGCYVGYPGYPITIPGTSTKVPSTHAGVLSYDSQGHTRYYEYGRYDSNFGNVRRRTVPDLQMGPDGKTTPESWANLQNALNKIGNGTTAKTNCDDKADADKINNFAEQRMNDPNRAPYSWNPFNFNTCTTFASDALAGGLK
uniref:RHS repeat-associated core domain-containing protein n=1 Tax=Desulfobulbus elongatus TaxID=53332 RepID=UPI001B802595